MTPNSRFSFQVGQWALSYKGMAQAIFLQSVLDVVKISQRTVHQGGSMPIQTGMLRGSCTIGINREPADVTKVRDGDSYVLELAGAKLGDVVHVRWTTEYAYRMEYGFYGTDSIGRRYAQQGYGYVRLGASQWLNTVKSNEQSAARAFGGV